MTDYTVDADWSGKDNLTSGAALKVVRGSEFQTEFDAIATAIATKYDSSSTVDINAGAIDSTTIGATTASTGAFTTLSASTSLTAAGLAYPTTDGTANQVLVTNGTGTLSFADAAGGVDGIVSSANATAMTINSVPSFLRDNSSMTY